MKIGIISSKNEGPVALALEQVYKALWKGEAERFSMQEFQPGYVDENSLDALLIEGRNDSDKGYAIALRRNIPEEKKICYIRAYRPLSSQNLADYNITELDMLDGGLVAKFVEWLGSIK